MTKAHRGGKSATERERERERRRGRARCERVTVRGSWMIERESEWERELRESALVGSLSGVLAVL